MAVARETLSPLLKNPQARRLSLELCQKLGFSNIFSSSTSPVKSPCENLNNNKNELKTPSPNKTFTHWPQNSNSPNLRNSSNQKSPLGNYRRGSDSFRWNCSPLSNLSSNEIGQRPIRRGSLTLTQIKDSHKPTEDVHGRVHNQYTWSPRRNSISVLLQDDCNDNVDSENGNYQFSEEITERAVSHDNAPLEEASNDRVEEQDENWQPPETQSIVNKNNKTKNKNISPSKNDVNAGDTSYIIYNIIPPSPKTSLKTGLTDENDNYYSECQVDIVPTTVVEQLSNTNVSENQHDSPFKWKDEEPRRKSSSTRYDFDDDFLHFVENKCSLELNPDNILGRGSFGTVITAKYHGKSVAVKLINTKTAKHSESMKCEENAMNLPPHPNIAKVIDIFQMGPDRALVIMERLRKGNLLSILNDPRIPIQIPLKIKLCTEIGSALVFCHVHGILHLDVKPQNVLIDLEDRCKLSDFGNSKKISDLPFLSNFNTLDGTVPYKAPELFRGICPSDKCDVYSFGISMWQILTRETPYKAETDHSIIYKVVSQGIRPRAKFSVLSPQLQSYIQIYEECWCQEPNCRPSMNVVLQHLQQLQLKV